jgi:hypothetical protein|tara:strand:+ start:1410 stop:1613 length:204 start_codon:yes stop_codon:yes gene_type:complete
MSSKERQFKNIHDINTFQCVENEVYLGGTDENGEDITIVFSTFELLEWLEISYMKEQLIKYINELNE